ncbi:MAG: hypothetical protein O3C63_03290 [Cyanobacteria bacterium]|nr:hypothetical protein [Cyanobacteriota bacterium]MDA1021588.1 hypothetical protein [Cyanobacteriota bacterium]
MEDLGLNQRQTIEMLNKVLQAARRAHDNGKDRALSKIIDEASKLVSQLNRPVSKQSSDVQVAQKKVATAGNARVAFGDNSDFQNKSNEHMDTRKAPMNAADFYRAYLAEKKPEFVRVEGVVVD